MSKIGDEEQINPQAFQAAALMEVVKKLTAIEAVQKSMIEDGVIEPLHPITVTTEGRVIHPPHSGAGKLWFGVKLTNDGPSSLYFVVNTEKSSTTPQELKINETWGVHFKTAIIEDVHLYTKSGTASVRIRGER